MQGKSLRCVNKPFIEVHLSNPHAREEFRHVDVLADVCTARFYGKGVQSYLDAVDFLTK